MQLWKFLKNQQIDLAVSQSSFHSPVVALLLGIPSIYTNDNEHAKGNIPSFLAATKILIPENLAIDKVAKHGVSAKKVIQYPGVKEGIFLWSKGEKIQQARNNNSEGVNIYFRPEMQTAQYYNARQNFLDDTIVALQHKYKIWVLPREPVQAAYYKQEKFNAVTVVDNPMGFESIASKCTIFIGAGGSMTREMAILGIPTISVYQDALLQVDEFLLQKGLVLHEPMLTAEKVDAFINSLQDKKPSLELMDKGKEAYQLFKREILKFKK